MTINYTTLLGLAKPVTGTESGVWGDVVNDQITSLVEDAIANAASISVTSGNVTLTDNNGSSDQSRMAILLVTGSPGVSRNIVAPSTSKWYIVKNSSNAEIVLKGSATTGVTIPAGAEAFAFWNGSDFELAAMIGPSSSTDNAVARFDGTTGKVVQNSAVTIADTTGDITTGGYVFTAAGAVGTPAYSTSGDTNTGMWFPAADTIAFSEGGTQAMTLDSSGNLAVGTTNTARGRVHAHATTNAQFVATDATLGSDYGGVFRGYGTGGAGGFAELGVLDNNVYTKGIVVAQNSDSIQFFTGTTGGGSTVKMQLTSSGNLGIGTTNPTTRLQISTTAGSAADFAGSLRVTNQSFTSGTYAGVLFETADTLNSYVTSIRQASFAGALAFGVNVGTNGTSLQEGMRLNSSGNLGIGTTSPNVRTEVSGTEAAVSLRVNTANTGNSASNYSEIQLSDVSAVRAYWRNVRDGTGATIFSYNDHLQFAAQGTERARITSGGSFFLGVQAEGGNANGVTLNSSTGYQLVQHANGTGSGTRYIYFYYNAGEIGSITQNGTTAVAYNTTSDYRLKENVQPMTGALSRVAALKPCTYTWKTDGSFGEGFIAHEVADVYPQAVSGEKDAVGDDGQIKPQGVDYGKLTPLLTAALQEAMKEIESLKARIAALEAA